MSRTEPSRPYEQGYPDQRYRPDARQGYGYDQPQSQGYGPTRGYGPQGSYGPPPAAAPEKHTGRNAAAPAVTSPAAPTSIAMPNLTGQSYAYALDKLDPVGVTVTTVDATGHGRMALDPFHWRVARQSVAPGVTVTSGEAVTLYVLKIGEADAGVTS